MAVATSEKNLKDGSITLLDGTGTPIEHVIPQTTGFSYEKTKRDRQVLYDTRSGDIRGVRCGKAPVLSGSFSATYFENTNGSALVTQDFIEGRNAGGVLVSTGGANFRDFFFCDVMHTVAAGPEQAADATITFHDCIVTASITEGDPSNTVNYSFESYGGFTETGEA